MADLLCFKLAYDRACNRLYRVEDDTSDLGRLYSYDGVNRFTQFEEGSLRAGKDSISSLNFKQQWVPRRHGQLVRLQGRRRRRRHVGSPAEQVPSTYASAQTRVMVAHSNVSGASGSPVVGIVTTTSGKLSDVVQEGSSNTMFVSRSCRTFQ